MQPLSLTIPPVALPFARVAAQHTHLTARDVLLLAIIVANPGNTVRDVAVTADVLIERHPVLMDNRLVSLRPTRRGVDTLSGILGDLAEDA